MMKERKSNGMEMSDCGEKRREEKEEKRRREKK